MSAPNRTIKNRFAKANENTRPSIVDYVDRITEWRMWPARVRDGVVYILFHNHEISQDEFLELQPKPKVENFQAALNNIDTTAI